MPISQIMTPYRPGYDYGVGADLASGSPMNTVVEPNADEVRDARGATVGFEISRIHSTSELESKLGINVEASYGCGSFGAGISGRFNFARDAKIQSSSLFMAITANIELAFTSIDHPTLTAESAEIVNRSDVFSARYGNMFVRGIGRGGLFVAVMRIDTSTSDESQSISAELEGSYGLFSAEASVKLDKIERDYRSEIAIKVYREGGPIDLAIDDINDPSQLLQMLRKWLTAFQEDPAANAKPYYVTLAPTTIASGPIPPNQVELQHAQDIIMFCARSRSRLLDRLNLMDYIIENPSRYDFPPEVTVADITKASNGYQADLDLIARTASQAINDPTKAVMPAVFAQENEEDYPKGTEPVALPTLKAGELPPPEPTIPVVSLVGKSSTSLGTLFRAFQGYGRVPSLADLQQQRDMGAAIDPAHWTQEQLNFLFGGNVFFEHQPAIDLNDEQLTLSAQFPNSGMVAPGSKIVLQWT